MDLIIGSHVSFTSKEQLLGSVKEAISYGSNTFMFYTGGRQSTIRTGINDDLTYQAYKLMLENNINSENVIVHSPYIINLANKSDERKYEFYIDFFIDEIKRVKQLGFNRIVLHPGSAVNCTKEEGINNIINALNKVISNTKDVIILLETMAGKGNEIGSKLEEIKQIIDNIKDNNRVGVCLDTCHLNDSGIDLNHFEEYLDQFDKEIGINKIKCVHVNDSYNEISSHKDRHQNIGYGTIGFKTLLNVVYSKRLEGIPFILETPWVNRNTKEEYPPYKFEIENFRNKTFKEFK